MFKSSHFRAVLFRKYVMIIRSWKSFMLTVIACIIASALAIAFHYATKILMQPKTKIITFNDFKNNPNYLLFVNNGECDNFDELKQSVLDIYEKDLNMVPNYSVFSSSTDLNAWVVKHEEKLVEPAHIPMAIEFGVLNDAPHTYTMSTWYNTSDYLEKSDQFTVEVMGTRAIWKHVYGGDFTISFTILTSRTIEYAFGNIGPIIMDAGLLSIIPLIISQPIIDITGEVRSYMVSCTLKILPYWLGTFLLDFIVWIITTTIVWAVFCIAQIQAFLDNMFTSWYVIVMLGPSFIIFMYVLSFAFDNPESAVRQIFLAFIILLLVPYIIQCIRWAPNPIWLEWVYALIPHLCLQRAYSMVLSNIGPLKKSFSYYWKDKASQADLIMEFGNIGIYGFILFIIESVRLGLKKKMARKTFSGYTDFFKQVQEGQEQSADVLQMKEKVENSHDFAVRIHNVSRLFFDTEGKPIPAVNNVSLGIEKGSLFGFLGANGAGKTTLIRMITSLLPPSDGSIEVNGVDIKDHVDPTAISICPQFNRHLCNEMTPAEHFHLYGLLFEMTPEEELEKSSKLIQELQLEDLKDKPLQELSQGDVRKLSIALSFYSRAKIILLDEPTASLDPVARHNVQELILEYKGDKTFMLCTHLLSEAEFLCDIISIMVKGCVFSIGSPEALAEKFGTIYKIDIMLKNDSDEEAEKLVHFFEEKLPSATLEISRLSSRIYDMPSNDIELPNLFHIMEEGLSGDNGYCYYTCSCSSLEHVFMEIIRKYEETETVL